MHGGPLDLLDRAPCGIVVFGDNGGITFVNATLADRLGYAREALIGKHVELLFTRAGQLFYQTHFFPLIKMHGRAHEVFLLLRTKAGDDFGALCNAVRREDANGHTIECVLLEVHERRKFEEALLQAKRQAEQANQLLEDQALELELQHEQLQDQAAQLERERTLAQQLQREADAANRAKSEFLATMSHELRTPLNAIGGYTELLRTGVYGDLNTQQETTLDRISRSQRHLLGLINDILNLARIEASRVDYRMESVFVAEVVAELSDMIDPQMRAKQHQYRVELPAFDARVRADHEKLVQVLLNLLSNAVKFTPPGGRIVLRCVEATAAGTLRIQVEDTGTGIPADKLETVFEPFVQVRADPARANEGTGLGLAISRNLARGMGGDLTATSQPGKGSCFSLTLERA